MKTHKAWMFNVMTLVVLGLFLAVQGVGANLDINNTQAISSSQNTISYQGMLTDPSGNPISGNVTMAFALYDAATDGKLKWGPETHTVAIADGLFNVLLGSVTPIERVSLPDSLYLDIQVNGESLSPREQITTTPYAIQAQRVPLVWPLSYDGRGVETVMPAFGDTLYYATRRGITVQANRTPDAGSLDSMFNLNRNSYGLWENVSPTNPVVITISYPKTLYISGVLLVFGWRQCQAIDYKIEYYSGTTWTTTADVTGNTRAEVYHPYGMWSLSKIKITITKAGEGDHPQELQLATIQAPSSSGSGKATGHMLDVGGDSMYGDLDMQAHGITNAASIGRSGNYVKPESGGHMRFMSTGGILLFLDTDNNSSDQYFRIMRDNDSMNPPYSFLFEVAENGTIGAYGQINMHGNTVTNCGALTEANLQTKEELSAERIDRFEEGDLLCWAGEQLEKCALASDPLVQAVADANGRPIIIGAELVKVIGPVQYGDLLVASDVPGYAMVNNDPRAGAVIAQALEDFDGEMGIIKAMIRKF